jgi:hypothetical protein
VPLILFCWDDTYTVKRNIDTAIDAIKEVDLIVNAEETKYVLLSRHQNARQNHGIKRAKSCFENLVQFTYLTTTVTGGN